MDYLSARNIGYLSQEMISYVSDVSYEIKELFYAESIITFWVGRRACSAEKGRSASVNVSEG
jgi:hypothetical protein